MAWAGENEPRVKVTWGIDGTVRVPGDKYWVIRAVGRRYTLVLADRKKRMHLLIQDQTGHFTTADSRGIYQ
jgi:hypothetical protein